MIKNNNFTIITLVLLLVSILSLSYLSSVNADKDFVMTRWDGRHCLKKKKDATKLKNMMNSRKALAILKTINN